jgi:hypothetical protein
MPQRDPDKRREYMRQWRKLNPDKVLANSRRRAPREEAYRKAHLAQYAAYQAASRKRNPQKHLVSDARSRARRDGLPCDITFETMQWPTHCPVLGIPLAYLKGGRKIRSDAATLDRRINELGYVVGNVFVLSHRANRIKSDATLAELEAVVAYVRHGLA